MNEEIKNELDCISNELEIIEGLIYCIGDSIENDPKYWHVSRSLNVVLEKINDIYNEIDIFIINYKEENKK